MYPTKSKEQTETRLTKQKVEGVKRGQGTIGARKTNIMVEYAKKEKKEVATSKNNINDRPIFKCL